MTALRAKLPDRLLVWGGFGDKDSMRHILRAFAENASNLGVPAAQVPDEPQSRTLLAAGDTVIVTDRYDKHIGVAVPGVRYVTHNLAWEHPLIRTLEQTPHLRLALQVWNIDATGEKWAAARSFDRAGRVLYQPWGSDLLEEGFMPPVYNRHALNRAVFIGAVWSDIGPDGVDMGNELVIGEVAEACMLLKVPFERLTQVETSEMIARMRGAALTPAFAGGWQVAHSYYPCRAFKAAAYGQLPLTNVPGLLDLLNGAALRGSVYEVMQEALEMDRTRYTNLVREAQRAISGYTYRDSLEAIERAFEEMADG